MKQIYLKTDMKFSVTQMKVMQSKRMDSLFILV